MAKFLTTLKAQAEIESIINNAQKTLVMLSPYVKIGDNLLQSLKDADRRKVKIIVAYGDKVNLEPKTINQLQQLENLSLRFLKNLHAKCFFNEANMVITSLNLYETPNGHNREMGVLLDRISDAECFAEAVKEATLIVNASEEIDVKKPGSVQPPEHTQSEPAPANGYCIRCGNTIAMNAERPLCPECYKVWERHWDPDRAQYYCHACGRSEKTTFVTPLCPICGKKFR